MNRKHHYFFLVFLVLSFSIQASFINIGIFSQPDPFSHTDSTIFTNPSTSISLSPGEVLQLWTGIFTDVDIAAVQYDTIMPTGGWILNSRQYKTYGWGEGTGALDESLPVEFNLPGSESVAGIPIINTLYNGVGESNSLLDIRFNAALLNGTFKTDEFVLESFSLNLPLDIAPGVYNINLNNIAAFDINGNPFHGFVDIGNGTFTVNVIPEPATISLFIIVISTAFFSSRSRRKSIC